MHTYKCLQLEKFYARLYSLSFPKTLLTFFSSGLFFIHPHVYVVSGVFPQVGRVSVEVVRRLGPAVANARRRPGWRPAAFRCLGACLGARTTGRGASRRRACCPHSHRVSGLAGTTPDPLSPEMNITNFLRPE